MMASPEVIPDGLGPDENGVDEIVTDEEEVLADQIVPNKQEVVVDEIGPDEKTSRQKVGYTTYEWRPGWEWDEMELKLLRAKCTEEQDIDKFLEFDHAFPETEEAAKKLEVILGRFSIDLTSVRDEAELYKVLKTRNDKELGGYFPDDIYFDLLEYRHRETAKGGPNFWWHDEHLLTLEKAAQTSVNDINGIVQAHELPEWTVKRVTFLDAAYRVKAPEVVDWCTPDEELDLMDDLSYATRKIVWKARIRAKRDEPFEDVIGRRNKEVLSNMISYLRINHRLSIEFDRMRKSHKIPLSCLPGTPRLHSVTDGYFEPRKRVEKGPEPRPESRFVVECKGYWEKDGGGVKPCRLWGQELAAAVAVVSRRYDYLIKNISKYHSGYSTVFIVGLHGRFAHVTRVQFTDDYIAALALYKHIDESHSVEMRRSKVYNLAIKEEMHQFMTLLSRLLRRAHAEFEAGLF